MREDVAKDVLEILRVGGGTGIRYNALIPNTRVKEERKY